MNNFAYDNDGLSLTESFEGCELTAYRDSAGVLTIGYGHTGRGVTSGMSITPQQAEALLVSDVAAVVACVNRAVTVEITQPEFDSLVDFTFNAGRGALLASTLLRKLNASDFQGASAEFLRWVDAGGVPNAGLLRRRMAERAMFVRVAGVKG